MKKLLVASAGIMLVALSSSTFANEDVGQKIYERAFGRGCGTCHDIASNPQLTANIKAGSLDRPKFETVLREGKGGMPKAIATIMDLGPVKKAGLTEDQAIDALYDYLKNK